MTSALASVNFYIGQVELQAQLRQNQLQRKLEKVQEACKKKLQEVHNGYTQAKRKYMEVAQEKQNLEADRAELQQKYVQKAQQARKLQEMFQKLQQENEMLRSGRGNASSALHGGQFRSSTPPPGASALGDLGAGNLVTTVHRKQVYLGPGHPDMNQNLINRNQQHLGGFLENPARRSSAGSMQAATPPGPRGFGGSGPLGRNALGNMANLPLDIPGRGNLGGAGFDSPGRRPGTAVQDLLGGTNAMSSRRKPTFLGSPSGLASGLASL
ncbi:g4998 [Coccomyxa elongata]